MYDYRKEMENDIKQYLEDNEYKYNFEDYDSSDDFAQELYDNLWCEDSITGNASGSYTFSNNDAEDYVKDNLDLLKEAVEGFCCKDEFCDRFFNSDFEWMDVAIRCYLLGEMCTTVAEELFEEFED